MNSCESENMTRPKKLKIGNRVRYYNPDKKSYGEDVWNGWKAKVLAIDNETHPYLFIKIELENPFDEWHPIHWVERDKLTLIPN